MFYYSQSYKILIPQHQWRNKHLALHQCYYKKNWDYAPAPPGQVGKFPPALSLSDTCHFFFSWNWQYAAAHRGLKREWEELLFTTKILQNFTLCIKSQLKGIISHNSLNVFLFKTTTTTKKNSNRWFSLLDWLKLLPEILYIFTFSYYF